MAGNLSLRAEVINLNSYLKPEKLSQMAELIFKDNLSFTIPQASNIFYPLERIEELKNRLSRLLAAGATPEALFLERLGDNIIGKYGDFSIFSVSPQDAQFFNISQEKLAQNWLEQIKTFLKLASSEIINCFEGVASWYGPRFHGRRTSSGEPYDMYQLTAAHRTLPLGTRVLVTNMDNGQAVLVKINDRGPFRNNRIIDLSKKAAMKIGITGLGRVILEVLK